MTQQTLFQADPLDKGDIFTYQVRRFSLALIIDSLFLFDICVIFMFCVFYLVIVNSIMYHLQLSEYIGQMV